MELIPILSTIILVATISTFILAIGAYILYKIREAKGLQTSAQRPAEVKGELVTPAASPVQEHIPVYRTHVPQRQPIFINQEKKASQPRFTPKPQQYSAEKSRESTLTDEKFRGKSTGEKFLKYTSEGYITPQEDSKKSGTLRWR